MPPLYVNDPELFKVKLVGFIVPLVKLNAEIPVVNARQVIVPILDNAPLANCNVTLLEQVKLNVAKLIVPELCV